MDNADARNEATMSHLSAEEVAAYLSRAVSAEERTNIQAHLAVCSRCCDEVAFHAHLQDVRQPSWKRPTIAVLSAAAVLTGVFLLGPQIGGLLSDDQPRLRDGQAPLERVLRSSMTVLAPEAENPIHRDSVYFAWSPVADDALYGLTLTDPEGGRVWGTTTRDTMLQLPPDIVLGEDSVYFWYVDALLPNGESPSTGVHRFTTR
jgi:hypothetical protein